jgi:thiol:disulfide interchange protein DsbD
MHKIAISAILSATLLLAPALAAQEDAHVVEVRSLVSRNAVKPGETFQAAVLLKVQAGFHINDNAPLDEFMIPTVLTVADSPDFEVVEIYYPGGRRARFSYSEAELVVYEGEVVLGALLKAKGGIAAGPRLIKAALSYQACDQESCLPPKEIAFEIAVPVSIDADCTDVHPEVFKKLRFKSLRK